MFEALVAVIYLDGNRSFERVYRWVCDRFIKEAVESSEELCDFSLDCNITITTRDYLDMIGLEGFPDYGWAPGDND